VPLGEAMLVVLSKPSLDVSLKVEPFSLQRLSADIPGVERANGVVEAQLSVQGPPDAAAFIEDYLVQGDRFRGDSSVITWLMRIAVNLVRDYGRNRRLQFWKWVRTSPVDTATIGDWIPDRGVSPEARAVLGNQIDAVWKATTNLSDRQRTVFVLRFVDDMDLLEIAAATGLTEGAVKVHLFRALQSIRKRIGSL